MRSDQYKEFAEQIMTTALPGSSDSEMKRNKNFPPAISNLDFSSFPLPSFLLPLRILLYCPDAVRSPAHSLPCSRPVSLSLSRPAAAEMLSPNFNEHFFQLKSLHSVHYEAAVVPSPPRGMVQWKPLAPLFFPFSLGERRRRRRAEKSNCGREWNEETRRRV